MKKIIEKELSKMKNIKNIKNSYVNYADINSISLFAHAFISFSEKSWDEAYDSKYRSLCKS